MLLLCACTTGVKRYNISGVPFFIITREGNKEKITLSGAQPVDEFEAAFEALS
jgi:predicted DsbA family dithiol-disulfide isomerase